MDEHGDGWLSPIEPIGTNVKRCLWYHSLFYVDVFGHGTMTGKTERIDTMTPHMLVQHEARLHAITIGAIERVLA